VFICLKGHSQAHKNSKKRTLRLW